MHYHRHRQMTWRRQGALTRALKSTVGPNGVGLSRLQTLITVTSYNGFDRTTLRLSLSRSAVDRTVTALRRRLKMALLRQKQRKTELAPINSHVASRTEKILNLLSAVTDRTSRTGKLRKNELQVNAFHDYTARILPKTVTQLRHHCPTVTVDLMRVSRIRRLGRTLIGNRTSLYITRAVSNRRFRDLRVFSSSCITLLPPNCGLGNDRLDLRSLQSIPLVNSSRDDYNLQIQHRLKTRSGPLTVTCYVHRSSSVITVIRRKLNVTVLPHLTTRPIPPSIHVYPLPFHIFHPVKTAVLGGTLRAPTLCTFLSTLQRAKRFDHIRTIWGTPVQRLCFLLPNADGHCTYNKLFTRLGALGLTRRVYTTRIIACRRHRPSALFLSSLLRQPSLSGRVFIID